MTLDLYKLIVLVHIRSHIYVGSLSSLPHTREFQLVCRNISSGKVASKYIQGSLILLRLATLKRFYCMIGMSLQALDTFRSPYAYSLPLHPP